MERELTDIVDRVQRIKAFSKCQNVEKRHRRLINSIKLDRRHAVQYKGVYELRVR